MSNQEANLGLDEIGRLHLSLSVSYDLMGEDLDELKDLVERNIRRMIGQGGLSGETSAEVDDWSLRVEVHRNSEMK